MRLKFIIGIVVENIICHISVKQVILLWITAMSPVAHAARCKERIPELFVLHLTGIYPLDDDDIDILHCITY